MLWVVLGALVALAFWAQRARPPRRALEDEAAPDPDAVGAIPIEDAIDLHGYPPKDIPDVADAYLEAAAEAGLREVRLIHGRGKGVQRARVRSLLEKHPRVEHFGDAPAHRGGWGAQIVTLKASSKER